MLLLAPRLKVDFEMSEELMEVMCQSDCIPWTVNVNAIDKMYGAVVEHLENCKRDLL